MQEEGRPCQGWQDFKIFTDSEKALLIGLKIPKTLPSWLRRFTEGAGPDGLTALKFRPAEFKIKNLPILRWVGIFGWRRSTTQSKSSRGSAAMFGS